MKTIISGISRLTAFVGLITFTFASCYNPIDTPVEPEWKPDPKVVITPGEGKASYFYIDEKFQPVEEDQGITALIIEDNPNAAGVLVTSQRVAGRDIRVAIINSNNKSMAYMFFRQGSDFPYYMSVAQGDESVSGYLSAVNSDNTFIITLKDNNAIPGTSGQMMSATVNPAIFTLYQDDPTLNDEQNLRLRNIVIAMGISGSLYNALSDELGDDFEWARGRIEGRTFFSDVYKFFAKVFKATAVAATFVDVVVVPVESFVKQEADLTIGEIAVTVATVSSGLSDFFNYESETGESTPQPSSPPPPSVVEVEDDVVRMTVKTNYNDVQSYKEIKNGDEFYMPQGRVLTLEFNVPAIEDIDKVSLEGLFGQIPFSPDQFLGWEPGNNQMVPNKQVTYNSARFDITLQKVPEKKLFYVHIDRFTSGIQGDGKVALGFRFNFQNKQGEPLPLYMNGSPLQPVDFQYLDESKPSQHDNTVVVWLNMLHNHGNGE